MLNRLGFWNYKLEFEENFIWIQDRNIRYDHSMNLKGEKIEFLGELQLWFNLTQSFSAGTKINIY